MLAGITSWVLNEDCQTRGVNRSFILDGHGLIHSFNSHRNENRNLVNNPMNLIFSLEK